MPASDLAFDRTGELLLVAADGQIIVLDVKEKETLAEYQAPGITSLAVSDDNRLLVWGDDQGNVHVWAK